MEISPNFLFFRESRKLRVLFNFRKIEEVFYGLMKNLGFLSNERFKFSRKEGKEEFY
jgi:hypothetical protein